jgi:hypothetical protein
MIFSFRPFIVTFLVLLQFVAPLVHAHTSEKFSSTGLHVPGLESYAHSTDNTVSTSDDLLCKVGAFCGNFDGQIVGVDTGVNREIALPTQRLSKIIADLDYDHYLPAYSIVSKPVITTPTIGLVIPAIQLPDQLSTFSNSPRAPPQA